jgi:hypothetical protein
MKANINIPQAKKLLDKYYEGETTLEEERLLQAFLSQHNLPKSFDADRAMFGFFAQEKSPIDSAKREHRVVDVPEPQNNHQRFFSVPLIRWSLAAAAIWACFFTLNTLFNPPSQSYAYINGKRYTDDKTIKRQVLASISAFADEPDEVAKSASGLNDKNLIKEQLQLFTEDF